MVRKPQSPRLHWREWKSRRCSSQIEALPVRTKSGKRHRNDVYEPQQNKLSLLLASSVPRPPCPPSKKRNRVPRRLTEGPQPTFPPRAWRTSIKMAIRRINCFTAAPHLSTSPLIPRRWGWHSSRFVVGFAIVAAVSLPSKQFSRASKGVGQSEQRQHAPQDDRISPLLGVEARLEPHERGPVGLWEQEEKAPGKRKRSLKADSSSAQPEESLTRSLC